MLRGSIRDKGEIWPNRHSSSLAEGRPGWPDIEDEGFWLNHLDRTLGKLGSWRTGPTGLRGSTRVGW